MSLVINTNTTALSAQRRLTTSGAELGTSMERLSSGRRINSAKDDAAGLAMSSAMTSQVRGLNQAVKNANDGLSMIQVTESALGESNSILQRMRELAVQSANGVYSQSDRLTLNAEVKQLATELDRIAKTTSFNGTRLLDGSAGSIKLQVGADAEQTISFNLKAADTRTLGLGAASGDLVGGEISVSNNGTLERSLADAAIAINGQVIKGVEAGSTVQTLLDSINESVAGVTAEAHINTVATSVGTGVLQGSDTLKITARALDGSQQVFFVGDTTSLNDLAAAINDKTGNTINASVEDGKLAISSRSYGTVQLQDGTGGVASGLGVGGSTISDPDIANVVEGLTNYWIAEAENLISTHYGITGDNRDMTLNLYTDAPGGALASISYSTLGGVAGDLTLNIDMADFANIGMPDGDPAGGSIYLDRVIAHEMVHAVTAMNMNMSTADISFWFSEGTAELIQGADERVSGDLAALNNAGAANNFANSWAAAVQDPDPTNVPGQQTSAGYSVSYAALKLMHEEIKQAGGTGIDEIFTALKGGSSLDAAISTVATANGITAWNSQATFEAHFATNGLAYINGNVSIDLGDGSGAQNYGLNLGDADTGSIAGSDYGNPALTAQGVLPNNPASGGATGVNLVLPPEYAGTATAFDARLVLISDTGEPIRVTKAANGSDLDMAQLGFGEVRDEGTYLGQAINTAAQQTGLSTGDLIINGVDIGPVDGNTGLAGKLAAINARTGETGVVASARAVDSFRFSTDATIEYTSGSASIQIQAGDNGVMGLNGIGFLVNVGDTASDIAASVNTYTDYHGVTAYADDDGRLHLFSETAINMGFSTANLAAALGGFTDTGAAGTGSVKLGDREVTFSDLSDQQKVIKELNAATAITGVSASLGANGRLELSSSAVMQVSLGDTNGLKTLAALGISFGMRSTDLLRDTDADKRLEDETFTLYSRIELKALNGGAIGIDVTGKGAAATGLKDLNAGSGAISGAALASISVATLAGAQKAIGVIDKAMESISDQRSELGAINNRLEFAISNLTNMSLSASTSRSRILDADFAQETAALGRAQVLQQASQAMLAQANSAPQQVLSLLR